MAILVDSRLGALALIMIIALTDKANAWSNTKMKTARPSSVKLYGYKKDYPYKNQYIREYNRRRRSEKERKNNQNSRYENNYYDQDDNYDNNYYYENDQDRRRDSPYRYNNQGYNSNDYGYKNVGYNNQGYDNQSYNNRGYDDQGYNNNQGYGYNNVQYAGTAAPRARPSERMTKSYNDRNNQIDRYNGYNYNEPFMKGTRNKGVGNSIKNAIEFSKNVDSAIDRMMTPIIRKASRGMSGTIRKGTNDVMRTMAPEDTNIEAVLDEALELVRYDRYVVQDLLQAGRQRIEMADDGQSIFSQYSTISSEIINRRQETFSTAELGVYLNFYPWRLWITSENGILQRLILENFQDNFEYDVLANYSRNNERPKYFLPNNVDYIDV